MTLCPLLMNLLMKSHDFQKILRRSVRTMKNAINSRLRNPDTHSQLSFSQPTGLLYLRQ